MNDTPRDQPKFVLNYSAPSSKSSRWPVLEELSLIAAFAAPLVGPFLFQENTIGYVLMLALTLGIGCAVGYSAVRYGRHTIAGGLVLLAYGSLVFAWIAAGATDLIKAAFRLASP